MKKLLTVILMVLFSVSVFARSWADIKESKEIRVGIRNREGVMTDGDKKGFHYDLITLFAEKNALEVKLVVKEKISDYMEDGIFEECDVIVDNLAITKDRKEKMAFINIFPIKQMVITKKDHADIKDVKDLKKKKILVTKGSSYEATFKKLKADKVVKVKLVYSAQTGDQIADLLADKGQVTVLDSNLVYSEVNDMIKVHIPVGPIQLIGWAVAKGNADLKTALVDFQQTIRGSSEIENIWSKYIPGIEYFKYIELIGE